MFVGESSSELRSLVGSKLLYTVDQMADEQFVNPPVSRVESNILLCPEMESVNGIH